jgi:electron transfer flavoprotein alpha subunit
MGDVIAILEQRNGTLKRVCNETLTAARALADELSGEVYALVIGPPGVSVDGLGEYGADRVLVCADSALELYQGTRYAQIAAALAGKHESEAVVLAATAFGKDLGPRIAAKLGCPFAGDVTSISAGDGIVVTRPAFSGKATFRLKIVAQRCVISIRPNAVTPVAVAKGGVVEQVTPGEGDVVGATTVAVKEPERMALDVAEASVVVAGGRGLKEPEHFRLIEELAAVLDGAVGASRAVVDAGWRPHSEQVGQTGKTVSPNLYIAIGLSGAIQHLAGMRTSKVIVAINRDKDAPIFKVADYGLVGDLFEIVPRLTEEVKKVRGS